MPNWLPIDTCPRDGTQVILWCPQTAQVTAGLWLLGDGEGFAEDGWCYMRDPLAPQEPKFAPTLWQEMPEPPNR